MNWLFKIFNRNRTFGNTRSPKWKSFKKDFEILKPKKCAVCGNKKSQLHHLKVFHLFPELELSVKNVEWFCQGIGTGNHHLWVAHLGSFRSWNESALEDAKYMNTKIKNRP